MFWINFEILEQMKKLQEDCSVYHDHCMQHLPFAPSFDILDKSMKWVPITSSVTESLQMVKQA